MRRYQRSPSVRYHISWDQPLGSTARTTLASPLGSASTAVPISVQPCCSASPLAVLPAGSAGLVLQGKLADRLHFSGAAADTIDLERTWALVEEFIATGEVRCIFLDYQMQKLLYTYAKQHGVSQRKLDEYFQYPRGSGRNHGIIRHWRGHVNHLHVRFRG